MRRVLATTFCLLCMQATAEPTNVSKPGERGDSAQLVMHSSIEGAIIYENDARSVSANGQWALKAGDLECLIHVYASGGPERASVTCPAGWDVQPPEARVEDGSTFLFSVRWSAF